MPIDRPDAGHRWRCARCGNLTRFDVTSTRRVREYWHLDLAGDPVEESDSPAIEVLSESIEQVACRWCGAQDAVALVARPGGPQAEPPA